MCIPGGLGILHEVPEEGPGLAQDAVTEVFILQALSLLQFCLLLSLLLFDTNFDLGVIFKGTARFCKIKTVQGSISILKTKKDDGLETGESELIFALLGWLGRTMNTVFLAMWFYNDKYYEN